MKKCFIVFLALTLLMPASFADSNTANSVIYENLIYLYGGTTESYIQQIEKTNNQIQTVAPAYFDIDENGNLKLNNPDPVFVDYIHTHNMKITPFISNHWNRQLGRKALENADQLTEQLKETVIQYNFDGISIDIENLSENEKDLQTRFLAQLAAKLHPLGKTISLAVAPVSKDVVRGWHASYDFAAIGEIVDRIFIMGYDKSYPGSAPGPVAPADWVENSIKYISAKVKPEKILLGIPFYGRYWRDGVSGAGIEYNKIFELISKNNGSIIFDCPLVQVSKLPNPQDYTF